MSDSDYRQTECGPSQIPRIKDELRHATLVTMDVTEAKKDIRANNGKKVISKGDIVIKKAKPPKGGLGTKRTPVNA